MEETTYAIVREFAASWGLVGLFVFFVGAVLFALRPGSREEHRDSANIPFRNEDKPASDEASADLKEARS